jgi:hypothetical protein
MGSLGERTAGVEVFGDRGVVPIGEIGDEVEQRRAQDIQMSRIGWIETVFGFR